MPAAVLLTACSSSSLPPKQSPSEKASPSARAPLPEAPSAAPESSASWSLGTEPAPPSAEDASQPSDNVIPESCQGADLDLDELLEHEACDIDNRGPPPPATTSVDARIEPANPTVRSGSSLDLSLLITNTTSAPLALDLDVTSQCENIVLQVQAYDRRGKRVDFEGGCPLGCPRRMLRVLLEPGGTLTKKLPFSARTQKVSVKTCELLSERKLPAGTYTLKVELPWADPTIPGNYAPRATLSTEITVR